MNKQYIKSPNNIIRTLTIIFQFVLPLFSVWLLCFAINYAWQFQTLSLAAFSSCMILAASVFCKNIIYKTITCVSVCILIFIFRHIWSPLQFFGVILFVAIFAPNFKIKYKTKQVWLMLLYMADSTPKCN